MSNFTARTRLRGEVTYHKSEWLDNYYDHGAYGVKFLEGEHEGETELEAKLYVYEMVIAASGMKTLEKKVKVKKPEMGFVGRK